MANGLKLHVTQHAENRLVEIGLRRVKRLDASTPQDAWATIKSLIGDLLIQLEAEPVRRLDNHTILVG